MRFRPHRLISSILCLLAGPAAGASAATLLFSTLDSLDGWTVRTLGPAEVRIVPAANGPSQAAEAAHVELRCQGGTVLLSRELPRDEVAGCRLELACLLKPDDVQPGAELLHTGKLHLALETPRGLKHFAARFSGTGPWREEGLVADVPGDVRRAVLNVGLEACAGRVSLARVSVRNNRRGVWPLPLAKVANAPFAQLGLGALPAGVVQWHGIPFQLVSGRGGRKRLRAAPRKGARRLAGRTGPAAGGPLRHGRIPARTPRWRAANSAAETPCVLWTARLAGGFEEGLSVFEGRQIGPLGSTGDLENWKVAWPAAVNRRSPAGSGPSVTLGVTRWPLYLGAPTH